MSFNKEIAAATTTLAPSNSKNTDRADEILPSTNAHIAINAAFADLPSHGGHIVILDGTVNSGGTILPVSNSHLSGMGTATKLFSTPGNIVLIQANQKENVIVEKMWLDGNKPGSSPEHKVCIYCTETNHATFRDLFIESGPSIGLYVGWASGPSNHVIIDNVWVTNCRWSGIAITSAKNVLISKSHVWNCGVGASVPGIDIEPNAGDFLENILLTGCVCNTNDKGIQVMLQEANFSQQYGVTIDDCFCFDNDSYGLVLANANHTIVSNSHLYDNTQDGIRVTYEAPRTSIHDCHIYGNTQSGILIDFGSATTYGITDSLITDNIIYDNGKHGMHIYGTTGTPLSRFRIGNNIIHNNGEWGLNLLRMENADVIHNTAYNNTSGDMNLAEYNNIRYFVPVSEVFLDLKEAHGGYVMNPVLGTGSEQTITGASVRMPDVTRNITITTTYGGSPSGDVVIEGTNAQSEEISETITIGGADTTVAGIKAFANCTKVIIPAGLTAPSYLQVGIGEKIGLVRPFWKNTDVYKIKKNYLENQTPGTVNVTYGTVDCTTITAHDELTLWYRANLNKFG